MIWTKFTYGQGSSFGILYFKNSADLAPKKIIDGGVNGSGLTDTRNGTTSLQYDYNGGKMPAFNMIDFFVDTHFDDRGRLGRMPAALTSIGQKFGLGVD
jgi:cyanophycinase